MDHRALSSKVPPAWFFFWWHIGLMMVIALTTNLAGSWLNERLTPMSQSWEVFGIGAAAACTLPLMIWMLRQPSRTVSWRGQVLRPGGLVALLALYDELCRLARRGDAAAQRMIWLEYFGALLSAGLTVWPRA